MKYRNFYHLICEGDARTKQYKTIIKMFNELVAKNGTDLNHPEIKTFCDRTDF